MPADPPIEHWPLPYVERLDTRAAADIDLVVIHCTELPDLALAREYGERVLYADRGTGASGHYYIDRDGRVLEFVEPGRTANHTRGYNPRSIGIELVNLGRYPDWFDSRRQAMVEPYAEAQIEALIALLRALKLQYPGLRYIAGHQALDRGEVPAADNPAITIRRKRDPGELFPWGRVLAAVHLVAPPEGVSD